MFNKLKYNCIGFDELVLWSLTQWVLITHILNITLSYDLSVIMIKHIYDWRNIRYVCLWSFLEYKHCSNNKLAVSMNDMPRICVAISPGDTPLTDCLHPCDKVQIISQQPALKTWLLHIFLGGHGDDPKSQTAKIESSTLAPWWLGDWMKPFRPDVGSQAGKPCGFRLAGSSQVPK